MTEFVTSRDRDAWFVVRGFKYQIDVTLLRWIQIEDNQILELETGEDIDTVAQSLDAEPTEASRLIEQVKHRDRSITLRSPESLAAIATAYEHRQANPEMHLLFRMVTNAPVGTERPSPFEDRCPAIVVWDAIRADALDPKEVPSRVAGIRSIIGNAPKPKGLSDETWAALQSFSSRASDASIVTLVKTFEWSTCGPSSDEASDVVQNSLVDASLCEDIVQAEELYRRLFVSVTNVLSQPGRKRLTRPDLLKEARLRPLAAKQSQRLELFASRVFDLDMRVSELEEHARLSDKVVSGITIALARFLPNVMTAEFHPGGIAVETGLPSKPSATCGREGTVAALASELAGSTWLSIRGGIGCGKSLLCLLLAEWITRPVVWIPLRDLQPQEAGICILTALARVTCQAPINPIGKDVAEIAAGLPEGTLIVLDDLPEVLDGSPLVGLLLHLATACRSRHGTLLSSSHYALPKSLVGAFGTKAIKDVPCPSFSDEEALALFCLHGAPAESFSETEAGMLNTFAKGHPTLLLAVARYMSSAGWRLDADTMASLQRHKHDGEVLDDTVRRLLATVEDAPTRGLLYRLSLVLGHFSFGEVTVVSCVPPSLAQPRERLSRLRGLWVEQETRDRMSVSPLVRPLAETELEDSVRYAVNEALGDHIVESGDLSVLKVAKALHYLTNGKAYEKAGTLTILALSWRRRMPKDQVAFLLSLAWLNRCLPAEMDLGLRIYLRAHQIAALDDLGRPLDEVFSDARALLREADNSYAWAVFGFAVMTLPAIARKDFGYATECLVRAVRAFPKARLASGEALVLPGGFGLGQLTWFIAMGIKSPDDLTLWLQTIADFNPTLRDEALAGRKGEHCCQIAIDSVWMAEHERPSSEQDWQGVLDGYETALSLTDGLPQILRVLLARAKVVVLAEYLDDIGAAVSCVSGLLDDSSLSASASFLLRDIVGRQFVYKKRYKEALRWLNAALAVETDSFQWIRYRTFLEASRSIGNSDPAQAVRLAEQAVELTQRHPRDIGQQGAVVAYGELAIAQWLDGNMPKAFEAYDRAADILLRSESDTVDWRQLFVFFANVGGYLATLAGTGEPPEKTLDGEPYAKPFRGILMGFAPPAADLYDARRRVLFYSLLAPFAEATGHDKRAAWWSSRGIEEARDAGMLEAISTLGYTLFPLLVERNEFAEAIDVAVEFCVAMKASMERHRKGQLDLQMGLNAGDVLGAKPSEAWTNAERDVAIQALPAIMTSLGEKSLNEDEDLAEYAHQVVNICEQIAATASDPELWHRTAWIFRYIFIEPTPYRELHEFSDACSRDGFEPLQALGYLGESLLDDAPIEVALVSQSVAVSYWARLMGCNSSIYRRGILVFLRRYWTQVVETQSFRFSPPAVTRSSLAGAVELSAERQAPRIFSCILSGLGRRLPNDLGDVAAWIRGA